MAHEDTGFTTIAHASTIPDFDQGIIGAGVKDMRGGSVPKADGIHVVPVTFDAKDRLARFDVVDVDRTARSTGDNFASVAGETN